MPDFLSAEDVLARHANQVDRYGGEHGVRDIGLLESAVAQLRAAFGGQYLCKDVFEMAAAYLYHRVQNHPFFGGNKRTGLVAALVFLDLNGVEVEAPKGSLYDLTTAVAKGEAGKAEIAAFFRSHAHGAASCVAMRVFTRIIHTRAAGTARR